MAVYFPIVFCERTFMMKLSISFLEQYLQTVLDSLHVMACGFYFIVSTNPNINQAWLDEAKDEIGKETNINLFLYLISMYWFTTVYQRLDTEIFTP